MIELPDCLRGGEEARLIPTAASTHREHFACSVLLASLRVVQPFARAFFDHLDWKVGSWAKIHGYTELVFRRQPEGMNCRPDGLLVLNTGKRERRLIVETKIGSGKIDSDQLTEYYRLAKANKVDAIITVSNELSADPTHLPYQLPKEIRHIPVFHWSWSYLVMLAELLLARRRTSTKNRATSSKKSSGISIARALAQAATQLCAPIGRWSLRVYKNPLASGQPSHPY